MVVAKNATAWEVEMEELKPCPFCGGKADFEEIERCYSDISWTVMCTQCGASIGVHSVDKIDVVETWNRRADNGSVN